MHGLVIFTLLIMYMMSSNVFAQAGFPSTCASMDCAKCHMLSPEEATKLLSKGGGTVTSVKLAPAPGLYELLVIKDEQQGIIYLDFSKKFLMQGMIVSLDRFESVTSHNNGMMQPKKTTYIDVASIPVGSTIIMGNPKGSKKLYVFTDPDCPYCRSFHKELVALERLDSDIAIHLLLFPLPMHPDAYDKSRSIIGAKSRNLLDMAFEGKDIPKPVGGWGKAQIDNVIAFAKEKGVHGTPTIVLPDGSVMVGSRDAGLLKRILDQISLDQTK